MTDVAPVAAQLGAAVHQNAAATQTGALERVFSTLFQGLVYAQIWEDPVADMAALQLGPEDDVLCIASGGCNAMSYLTASPASLTAVDLSPAHVALLRLKCVAAQELEATEFWALFGRADRAANVSLYDARLAPRLDAESRAYWEGRVAGRRRITMLSRGFYRFGLLGRFIGAAHTVARLKGVDFRPFLRAESLDAQRAYFDAHVAPLFDAGLVRWAARRRASLFGLGIPPAQYDKLAADGGGDVLPVLRERTRRLMCDFPVSNNYFAWQAFHRGYPADARTVPPYLQAAQFDTVKAAAPRVTVSNVSLTDRLASAPSGAFSAYVFLDAQDWMTDAQLTALWHEVTRTARPGARVLFRTGGAPDILPGRVPDDIMGQWSYDAEASTRAFAADRSAIYGGVHLYRLAPA